MVRSRVQPHLIFVYFFPVGWIRPLNHLIMEGLRLSLVLPGFSDVIFSNQNTQYKGNLHQLKKEKAIVDLFYASVLSYVLSEDSGYTFQRVNCDTLENRLM
jgi:hypothetical protein